MIYAARERALPGRPTLPGFPESHCGFRSAKPWRQVLFGETGNELYAVDQPSGAWLRLDRASLSPLETCPTCEAMLAETLRHTFES